VNAGSAPAPPPPDGDRAAEMVMPSRAAIFRVRALSAAVLAPLVLAAVYVGWPVFEIMLVAAGSMMAWEWSRMINPVDRPVRRLRIRWTAVGIAYVIAAVMALVWLRSDPEQGRLTVFWLLAVVWATDIGAYVVGSLIGGPKLAPRISPGKTWAGVVGGLGFGLAVGVLSVVVEPALEYSPVLAWSLVASIVCQIGDLAESALKRSFGVKDSGRLIPGHGGLLDRMDGMMAAALAVAAAGLVNGGSVLAWQ